MKNQIILYGGIEGGGTNTTLSLFNKDAKLVISDCTGTTNPWLLGRDNNDLNEDGFTCAARRITELITKCLNELKHNDENANYKLIAVGVCLSGGGCKSIHDRVIDSIKKFNIDYEVYVGNDSLSSMFTAFENGGLVVISGTGSKCVLVNPVENLSKLKSFDDINCLSSGGWGNMLGDEGSAYWIAQRGIKFVIDYNDNFLIDIENVNEDYDKQVTELKNLIFDHFDVKTLDDLLPHFYHDFRKSNIASLTAKLSTMAEKNSVVKSLFEESGFQLARHIVAIFPKIDKSLLSSPGGLPIICVGSVFKSWKLIKPGFIKCLQRNISKLGNLSELRLVIIKKDSCIGAAILATKIHDYETELGKKVVLNDFINELDHLKILNCKQNGCQTSSCGQIKCQNQLNSFILDDSNNSFLKEA